MNAEWWYDAGRDVVLLLLGALVAWFSGVSAANRTARLEARKQSAIDEARREEREQAKADERQAAMMRETRRALNVVEEMGRALESYAPQAAGDAYKFPLELTTRLRETAAAIPDESTRDGIDHALNLLSNWQILVHLGHDRSNVERVAVRFQRRVLARLRKVLSTVSAGEEYADLNDLVALESLSVMADHAWESYYASVDEHPGMRFHDEQGTA